MTFYFAPYRTFALALIPAAIGGALWAWFGLPLAWLMGAAIVTGIISATGVDISIPKPLYRPSLVVIGAGVGLTITPSVAVQILAWLPLMAVMSFTGVFFAAIATPFVAKRGGMESSTAFFSLMPGGVIEMANIGEPYGADRTTITMLHAIRLALVVFILPLSLFALFPSGGQAFVIQVLQPLPLAFILAVGLIGGWVGSRVNLPAAWLLGALIAVALVAATGVVDGTVPAPLLAVAQVFVGMSLGAKFKRERLAKLPRAIAVGGSVLTLIIVIMASLAMLASLFLPLKAPELILAFSIGGVAEMVLTARSLELNMAIVAAFQSVRGVLVNGFAGLIWQYLSKTFYKGS